MYFVHMYLSELSIQVLQQKKLRFLKIHKSLGFEIGWQAHLSCPLLCFVHKYCIGSNFGGFSGLVCFQSAKITDL